MGTEEVAIGFDLVIAALLPSENMPTYTIDYGDAANVVDFEDISTPEFAEGATYAIPSDVPIGTYNGILTYMDENGCTGIHNFSITIAPGVLYVDKNVVGGNGDGISWANAFTDLQDAIDEGCNCTGTLQIWVAAGTYLPTRDKEGSIPKAGNRTKLFYINCDVEIYGGFLGNAEGGDETLLSERDSETNVTILSGDFDGDDMPITDKSDSNFPAANNGENAYTVLQIEKVSTACKINGFTITGGNSDADNSESQEFQIGGGMLITTSANRNADANPTIINCQFKHSAAGNGGAVGILSIGGNQAAAPSFSNCTFAYNLGGYQYKVGGAISAVALGESVAYNLQGNITNSPNVTFSWVATANENIGGESTIAKTGGTINDVLTNNSNTIQTVIYTITPTSEDGCIGQNFNVVVNVKNNPLIGAVGQGFTAICGTDLDLELTLPTGSSGNWSLTEENPVASAIISDLTDPMATLTGVFGGAYTLRWTVNDGVCEERFTEVMIDFSPDQDIPGGDGVQDCVDVCIGGDDSVNSDNSGLPDDCDCSPTNAANDIVFFEEMEFNALLNDVLILGGDTLPRIADLEMTSNIVVDGQGNANYPTVILQAADNITLIPGFQVKAGSNFLAFIEDCLADPMALTTTEEGTTLSQKLQIEQTEFLVPSPKGLMDLKILPNIVQHQAKVKISLPEDQLISLFLYNQQGQRIRTLLRKENRSEGTYYFKLDASQLPGGFYFLRMQGAKELVTQKFVVGR